MAKEGQWLTRSFLVGYGAGAGHSAWRATKSRASYVVIAGLAVVLTAAPLFFVYKTAKATFERTPPNESRATNLALFGGGAILSVMYLGWALYWSTFAFSAIVHPAKLPGYNLVPEQATTVVYRNVIHSTVRAGLLVGKLFGRTAQDDDVSVGDIYPNAENSDLLDTLNLVARLYFLAFFLGVFAGVRQRISTV